MNSSKEVHFTLMPPNFKEVAKGTVGCKKSEYMENYNPSLFCRTCANIDTSFIPIFKDEGLHYDLNKKIEQYLPIRVSQNDDLPIHLCHHCASTLVAWDSLIVGCIAAEEKLKSLKKSLQKQEEKCNKKKETLLEVNNSQSHHKLSKFETEGRQGRNSSVSSATEYSSNQHADNLEISDPAAEPAFSSKSEEYDSETGDECEKFETLSPGRGKKIFKCDACKRVFNRKFNFERHLTVHSNKSLTCHACGKQYRRQSVLDRHIKVVHEQIRIARLSCDSCGKMFSSAQTLEDHSRTHTGERPFICEVCGKDFRARPNLIAHRKIHSGELPFACSLCEYRCRLKSTFVDHCQRHEGTRTCLCSVCGKGFVNNYDLMKHKKTHSQERRFTCEFCHLTFVMKRYLKVHMRTHMLKEGLT